MHELSIALNLVQIAEEAARKEKAERVRKVYIAVGALSGVVPEALLFEWVQFVREERTKALAAREGGRSSP